jgi:hypothetical protein
MQVKQAMPNEKNQKTIVDATVTLVSMTYDGFDRQRPAGRFRARRYLASY